MLALLVFVSLFAVLAGVLAFTDRVKAALTSPGGVLVAALVAAEIVLAWLGLGVLFYTEVQTVIPRLTGVEPFVLSLLNSVIVYETMSAVRAGRSSTRAL